jgi:hypothetical protein
VGAQLERSEVGPASGPARRRADLVEVEGHEPAPDAPGHPQAHRQLGVALLQPAVAVDLGCVRRAQLPLVHREGKENTRNYW